MKNIHILTTDKPSKLLKTIPKNNLILSKSITSGSHWENQNIYITSDEEIKDKNCWVTNGVEVFKPMPEYSLEYANRYWEKIILTTDQDLIKDGVQAIPDEFLEWICKNPSCKNVKVEGNIYKGQDETEYKIIIPKEELKQETIEEREWLTIFKEYTKDNESNLFMFFNWLETNYNPPTKKII